jgi:VWFA-related protein
MSRLVLWRVRARAVTTLAVPFLVTLLLSAPLLAQSQPPAPAATPRPGVVTTEEVHVLTLDVVAVDGKNRPVFGLTAADFEVRVAGKVQTIDFFEAPPGRAAAPAGAPAEGRPDSEERYAGTTAPFDPKATLRHVLVWVDLEQLPRRSIMDTATALHQALDHAPAGRYGLVTHFGGPSARVWDADSVDALLAEADRMSLEVAENMEGPATRTAGSTGMASAREADSPLQYEARKIYEKQLIDNLISTQQAGGDTRLAIQAITDYLSAERRRVRASVDDLRETAGRLAAFDGPRHLILMSEGFERVPGFDFLARLKAEQGARVRAPSTAAPPTGSSGRGRIFDAPSWPGAPGAGASVGGGQFAFDSSPLYEVDDLAKWFAPSGVIVHFLDPGGLGRDQPSAADRYAFESKLRTEDLKNLQETPLRYAADTGGLSRVSTNDIGSALTEFLDATSATYRIGVRLVGVDPKKTYSVKVATRKAGVNMLARSAFRPSGPAPQVASALAADARHAEVAARADAQRPGAARTAKKPIPLTLEWKGRATTPSPDPAKPFWKVEVRISHEELRFETESDAFVASVKIAVEAAAVDGPARDSATDDWFLSYTGDEYKEVRDTAASRLVTLQLPPGRYDLRVSVNDALGGTFGQASLRVDAR